MPPITGCWRATSRRCAPSRRRRCRRWTAMRCARPMPRPCAARLKVIGEVAAGRPFEKTLGAGEAVRIFTGGVIPDGADAVVIQEDTVVDGRRRHHHRSRAPGTAYPPRRHRLSQGRRAAGAGSRLTDRDLSLAAGMNYPELPVRRRPKVAMLATGDELVMPGSTPRPRTDRLFQRLCAAGAGTRRGRRDHRSRHRRRHHGGHHATAFAAPASGADILVTMGGASVGDHDLVKQSLEAEGVDHGVLEDRDAAGQADDARTARRDAGDRPARQSRVVLCLRLPVSGAADSRAVGASGDPPRPRRRCSGAMSAPTTFAKTICAPACEARADGVLIATPVDHQDFSLLGNLAAARALVIRAPFAPRRHRRLGLRYPAAAGLTTNGPPGQILASLTRN